MSFILVPFEGEDLQVNAWNWRPTLELLFASGVITQEDHELMGCNGSGATVDADKSRRIADVITRKLVEMNPGERMLADRSFVSESKKRTVFSPDMNYDAIDNNETYSTTFEWLETFAEFSRSSGGFKVM